MHRDAGNSVRCLGATLGDRRDVLAPRLVHISYGNILVMATYALWQHISSRRSTRRARTSAGGRVSVHMPALMPSHMPAHMCLHTCLRACLHTCLRTCLRICLHACLHACRHVCTHVYTPAGSRLSCASSPVPGNILVMATY